MDEALRPTYVRFDAHSFFDHPDDPRRQCIGVVTQIGYAADGDALHVQVGVGDSGTHDALAERMGPIKNKRLPLPPDMYTCEGIVTGWYYPDLGGSIGIIAGQNERRINLEATCSYDETNRRLRMAGLALGYVLLQDPRKNYHLVPWKKPCFWRSSAWSDRGKDWPIYLQQLVASGKNCYNTPHGTREGND